LDDAFEEQKRFVSDVSHELRIPITIIQGYVDIIQTWGKNDEKLMNESLDAISAETLNMKELVEKLLLLQKLGSGNYNFDLQKIDINRMLEKAVFETNLIAPQHIVVNELSDLSAFVLADRSLLAQSIRSIIDNSIKYTRTKGDVLQSAPA
jgi:signal transduction histidine kinase